MKCHICGGYHPIGESCSADSTWPSTDKLIRKIDLTPKFCTCVRGKYSPDPFERMFHPDDIIMFNRNCPIHGTNR
jgi:hypothetical protein